MLDFGPRYYNAMLGRFLSPDPILAGASTYSYAAGNPVMLYDPSGMRTQYVRLSDEEIAYRRELAIAHERDMAIKAAEDYAARLGMRLGINPTSGVGNVNLPGGVGGKTPDGIVVGGRPGVLYDEYVLVHFTSNAGQDYYYFKKTGVQYMGTDAGPILDKPDVGCSYEVLSISEQSDPLSRVTDGRPGRPEVKVTLDYNMKCKGYTGETISGKHKMEFYYPSVSPSGDIIDGSTSAPQAKVADALGRVAHLPGGFR